MSLLLLFGNSFAGVLDSIGMNTSQAYSMRRMRKGYSGKCCNIRRSSDSSSTDIGFTSTGDFDQASYEAFCGKNFLLNTATLSTQSVTVVPAKYVLSFQGTGTVTLSGTSTAGPLVGTGVSNRVSLAFTPTSGSLTLTVSGSVTSAQLEFGSTASTYEARTGTAASSGFITTWYDQSTNALNATQGTQATQPQLLPRQHGEKPMSYFKASGTNNLAIASVNNPTSFCMASVGNASSSATSYPSAIFGNPHAYYRLDTDTWGTYLNGYVDIPFAIVAKSSSIINVRAFNDVDLIKDGTKTVKTNGLGFFSRASAWIGTDGSNYLDGYIGEIFVSDVLSSGQTSALTASHQSYWGTP